MKADAVNETKVDGLLSEVNSAVGDFTQGEAHQSALRTMYTNNLWGYNKYETFEWGALLGNPDLGLGNRPAITIDFPDGIPETVLPGLDVVLTVRISNGVEQYEPGSGVVAGGVRY